MTHIQIIVFIKCLLIFSFAAAELNETDSKALQQTQQLLKDKASRNQAIKESPGSEQYVDKMNQMGMNENQKNTTFDISADIFGQLVEENNGDAEAVKKILLKASQNPEAFYNSLSPQSKRMIQNLGQGIELNGSKPPK